MSANPIPYSRDELHKLFRYYGETGLLHWRESPGHRVKAGAVAGRINARGYRRIKLGGTEYGAHRIIFKMLCDQEPDEIDHIDGDTGNNRIGNLRAATHSGNQRNQKRKSTNTSGEPCIRRHCGKWEVRVCHIYYGRYATIPEAVIARDKTRRELGGFTNRDVQEAT